MSRDLDLDHFISKLWHNQTNRPLTDTGRSTKSKQSKLTSKIGIRKPYPIPLRIYTGRSSDKVNRSQNPSQSLKDILALNTSGTWGWGYSETGFVLCNMWDIPCVTFLLVIWAFYLYLSLLFYVFWCSVGCPEYFLYW